MCARLDGIPLAIELAAARMNAMSLDTLSRALAGRFALLTTGARTALPRHQSLAALIDWSYEMLGPVERRVFRRLAVFSGGWTLEAAQAIFADADIAADQVLTELASLVDKSLVIVDAGSATLRYTMLETTRAYAFERLTAKGERDPTAERHAKYFSDLLVRSNARWGTVPMPEWLAPLRPELDNLRAALQWSLVDGHDVNLGAAIAVGQHSVLELLSLERSEGWSATRSSVPGKAVVRELISWQRRQSRHGRVRSEDAFRHAAPNGDRAVPKQTDRPARVLRRRRSQLPARVISDY